MSRNAYADPNITRPITDVDIPQVLADQFPTKTVHARIDVYDDESTNFGNVSAQPPLPSHPSYWTLGRDLYANQGAAGQPFFE